MPEEPLASDGSGSTGRSAYVASAAQAHAGLADSADAVLFERLRAGDEQALLAFAASQHAKLLRLAAVAAPAQRCDALIQDAWQRFFEVLDAPLARSAPPPVALTPRLVLYRELVGCLRAYAQQAGQPDPFAAVEVTGPSVPADRFRETAHRWEGGWLVPPTPFPGAAAASPASVRVMSAALDALPTALRAVLLLRDLARLSADEVCNVLDLSSVVYRAMLHRARSQLRAALERHYAQAGAKP